MELRFKQIYEAKITILECRTTIIAAKFRQNTIYISRQRVNDSI